MQQRAITKDAKKVKLKDEVRQSQSHVMCPTDPYAVSMALAMILKQFRDEVGDGDTRFWCCED
jgi:hypothetical protein